MLNVDRQIIAYLRRNPGANTGQTSTALLRDYTGTYIRDRIRQLIARGMIRAEVNESNRYRLFVAGEDPAAGAIKA